MIQAFVPLFSLKLRRPLFNEGLEGFHFSLSWPVKDQPSNGALLFHLERTILGHGRSPFNAINPWRFAFSRIELFSRFLMPGKAN